MLFYENTSRWGVEVGFLLSFQPICEFQRSSNRVNWQFCSESHNGQNMFWGLPVNLNFAVLFQKQNKTKQQEQQKDKAQLTCVGFFWIPWSIWKLHSRLKKQKLLAILPLPRTSCYWSVLSWILFLYVHVHLDLCRNSNMCSFIILPCSYLLPVPQCPLIEKKI